MKKILSMLCLLIVFFVLYFLQANFFTWFTISGVRPNLFVIFILLIGLFTGKKIGAVLGIVLGVYLDLLVGRTIGISGILLGVVGLLGEYFDKNFSKESRITIILMVIGCTIFYETGNYIYSVFGFHIMFELYSFLKILLIEVLYNVIIVIITYPLIQKAGYALENIFKVKNILTRYF